jgi:DNA (cytosine-5)-methyltransferase 1
MKKRKRSNVDNTQNIISFCTGYGGLELGIRRAGVDVRVICNVEIEAFVQANLVAKIEEGRMDNAPIWTDLKTFPAREFLGKISGLIGGYPCQPFSSAGKRQGEKDPRHLWPYIREHIRAIRPVWCFWENVAGHTTMGLWRVLSDLEEEGYRCAWGIFSAEEVGAPHQRKRVFILAKLPNARSPYSGEVQFAEGRAEEDTKEQESNCNGNQRGVKHVVNTTSEGLEGCARESVQGRSEGLTSTDGEVLGNSPSLRPHRGSENCEGEQSEVLGERLESDEWPARPGEEQYEWEEPRVVGNTEVKGCRGMVHEQSESGDKKGGHTNGASNGKKNLGQAQSFMGGATNGTQHRVDRLRLLGNGVVPQTAELAWKTLWKELNAT